MPGSDFAYEKDEAESVHFAHARRHIFCKHYLSISSFLNIPTAGYRTTMRLIINFYIVSLRVFI